MSGAAMMLCQAFSVNSFWLILLPPEADALVAMLLRSLRQNSRCMRNANYAKELIATQDWQSPCSKLNQLRHCSAVRCLEASGVPMLTLDERTWPCAPQSGNISEDSRAKMPKCTRCKGCWSLSGAAHMCGWKYRRGTPIAATTDCGR